MSRIYRQPLLFLIILLLLAVIPIFKPYVSGTADGLGHRFRLVSFYTSLREGNIRPRWSREAALGFGAPLFLFNYPLPYYIASFFLFLGFSVNAAGQLLGAFSLLLSGIGMYLAGKKLTGNTWGGITAAIVYTYAPYHLQMTYLYDAWGEILAFVFPPWILYFILQIQNYLQQDQISNIKNQKHPFDKLRILSISKDISKSKNIFYISSVSFIFNFLFLILFWFLFILSHNVSVLMFTPVLILLGVLMNFARPPLAVPQGVAFIKAFVLAVLVSAFFWLPALILAKDMRYLEFMRTEAAMRGSFFKPIIFQIATAVQVMREGVTHYLDFTVGLPILFLFLWSLKEIGERKSAQWEFAGFSSLGQYGGNLPDPDIHRDRATSRLPLSKKNYANIPMGNRSILVTVLLMLLLLSLYFTQSASNWFWQFPPFTFILYPFRFLFLATFAGALLGGLVGAKNKAFAIGLILFALFQGNPYLSPYTDIFPFPDSYFYQKQTISSAPGTRKNMLVKEFLPVYANAGDLEKLEFQPDEMVEAYLKEKGGRIEIVSSNAEKLELKFSNVSDDTLVINRFYFPNWNILLDGRERRVSKDEMGRIAVDVPQGNHKVELTFGISKIEKLANLISFLGVIIWGGVLWKRWRSVYS